MLKELLTAFRKDSLLDKAFRQSSEMLDISKEMFLKAKGTLRREDARPVVTSVYDQDKRINKYQRNVRKRVLQHLSVAGPDQLPSGLTLINVIIDIERIGDYTKNMIELAENHQGRLEAGNCEKDLTRVETAVEDAFTRLRHILETSDDGSAEALIEEYLWINPLCDERIAGYVTEADKSVSCANAVTLALYFRYLKRIHSHLRNVATCVYRPFHKIGFVPSKVLKQT